MPNTALSIDSVSKLYKLGVISTGTLSHDLNRWWHRVRGLEDPYQMVAESNVRDQYSESGYVWALKDVSFEVKHGEAIGIIGKNGAGKSTLLKILSKVTSLTRGEIRINGRIASLLEVGTGFHGELTGRENIFLNGTILGMKKHEIRSRLDEIIDFSGVERFIDTPVKRYSSGMYVRLAFAVAAHLEPEILIVDEVLAVGDAEFQKKAIGKMQDVSQGQGRTVLFVSHNMSAVQKLCPNSVLIENGRIRGIGSTFEIIQDYFSELQNVKSWQGSIKTEVLILYSTYVKSLKNGDSANFYHNDELEVGIELEVIKEVSDLVCGFNLISGFGYPILRANYNDFNLLHKLPVGRYLLKFKIPSFFLAVGNYVIDFDIAIPNVNRLIGNETNLSFKIMPNIEIGNKYAYEGSTIYNSIIRPNIFINDSINPIKERY